MDPRVLAAIIAGVIGIISSLITVYWLKPLIDRRLHLFRLKEDYKHEQAKKIKEIIGQHKSHIVNSGELLHSRLKNYSRNHAEGWLDISGDYRRNHHYMDTTVYRFLSFLAHIKILEEKLEYLDTVNSDNRDMEMLRYFRVIVDVMTDVELFKGLKYNSNVQTDHFFRNKLGQYTDALINDGKVITFDEFEESKELKLPNVDAVYQFFDGISPNEERLRIERLKAFHCILMSFLNFFGYDFQSTEISKVEELKGMIGQFKLLPGTLEVIVKYKLKESRWDAEKILRAYS